MVKGPGEPHQKLPVETRTIQWTISSERKTLNNHAFGAPGAGELVVPPQPVRIEHRRNPSSS